MNDGSRPKAASTSFARDDNLNGTGPGHSHAATVDRPSAVARTFAWAVDRPFEIGAALALAGWAAFTVGGLR